MPKLVVFDDVSVKRYGLGVLAVVAVQDREMRTVLGKPGIASQSPDLVTAAPSPTSPSGHIVWHGRPYGSERSSKGKQTSDPMDAIRVPDDEEVRCLFASKCRVLQIPRNQCGFTHVAWLLG